MPYPLKQNKCGHEFIPKTKTSKPDTGLSLSQLKTLVKKAGGYDELKKSIDEYEKIVAPIDKLGGYKEAKNILKEIEDIKGL